MNVDVSVRNVMYVKKNMFEILLNVSGKWENLTSFMDDSAINCDEVIDTGTEAKLNNGAKSNKEETKTVPKKSKETNITCKTQDYYILLAFLLTTIAF